MKLKDANYKSHRNILVSCDRWKMMSDLNISHEKMSDFVSLSSFGFTLGIKLRNFDFESHWNTLIFFDQINNVRFQYVLSNIVWFKFRCSSRILAIVEEYGFQNLLRKFNIFQLRNLLSDQNLSRSFLSFVFFGITMEINSN